MSELTATGLPFGSGKVLVPDGSYDFMWKKLKSKMLQDPEVKEIRAKMLLSGIPRELVVQETLKMIRKVIPYQLSDKDAARYAEELTQMFMV